MTDDDAKTPTWRTTHGDMTDEEWVLIADLVEPYSSRGRMGRPVKNTRRDVVNAIFYVASTGCQWRALPERFPHWNTVHRYHLRWSRDGTWEAICARLTALVREREGRDPECSASVVDARSVRGAATVTSSTRAYDAGKKVPGRKAFGVVDTLGLLVAVVVVAASVSDNASGITVIDRARKKTRRLKKVFHHQGSSAPSSPTAPGPICRPRSSGASPPGASRSCPGAGWSSVRGPGSCIIGASKWTMCATPS